MKATTKKTQSLCPNCFKKIPARIREEKGRILIHKKCPRHGSFTGLIESDARFYHWFARLPPPPHGSFVALSLPITYRCPLPCRECLLHTSQRRDRTVSEIMALIKNFRGQDIELTGGEPTVRTDLAEIIDAIRKLGKTVTLHTNGLRLAHRPYLKSLKKTGLGQVLFSFDSFKNSFYNEICGKNLFALKRKALSNLECEGMPTILSATIYPGLNDRELTDLFIFAFQNRHFINQLRLRTLVPAHGPLRAEDNGLSGLFGLISKELNINKKDLKEKFFKARLGRSAIFHFTGRISGKRFIPSCPTAPRERTAKRAQKPLEVKIVSWPTVRNIDLQDLKTSMAYLPDNKKKGKNVFHGMIIDAKSQSRL